MLRCPFNRRTRRRLARSRGVIVHLFAGHDHSRWALDTDQYEVLPIDVSHGSQYDLHNLGLWSYLWDLASSGKIVGVVGGPPCRTVSRLRHTPPGPRPVRGRGEQGYGRADLTPAEKDLVNSDTALFMKQLGLWERAQQCGHLRRKVAFVLESPSDPVSYDPEAELRDMPSFWELQDVERAQERNQFFKVSFDQGALGHARRKPTTLLSNLEPLRCLQGLEGEASEVLESELGQRLKQTKLWAAWAPGLVSAV